MLESFQDQKVHHRSVKIGISKQACWLCQWYLEFLERNSNPAVKFIVSGFQGKIHAGWKPPAGPSSALGDIVRLVKQETDEILRSVQKRRRSDSFPIQPNPEDIDSFVWNQDYGSDLRNMF